MIESKQEVSKDLEKALQALEQAKQCVANCGKKPVFPYVYHNAHGAAYFAGIWANWQHYRWGNRRCL